MLQYLILDDPESSVNWRLTKTSISTPGTVLPRVAHHLLAVPTDATECK